MKNVVRIHTEKTEDASMESYKLTLGYKTSVTSKCIPIFVSPLKYLSNVDNIRVKSKQNSIYDIILGHKESLKNSLDSIRVDGIGQLASGLKDQAIHLQGVSGSLSYISITPSTSLLLMSLRS